MAKEANYQKVINILDDAISSLTMTEKNEIDKINPKL
jgi:hypothetical protein